VANGIGQRNLMLSFKMIVIKCANLTGRITTSVLPTFQLYHILFQSLHFPLCIPPWKIIKSLSGNKVFSSDMEMLKMFHFIENCSNTRMIKITSLGGKIVQGVE
jgi:hypothetical protein